MLFVHFRKIFESFRSLQSRIQYEARIATAELVSRHFVPITWRASGSSEVALMGS
jgi:hypothetical protein